MKTCSKQILCTFIAGLSMITVQAQSGGNSPYSRFGIGLLNEQNQTFNAGMNGLHQGFRSSKAVNSLNPASYSAIDSLTFLLDAGMTLQNTHMSQNGNKVNSKDASFDYLMGAFRIVKGLGMTVGIKPFSDVNYSYTTEKTILSDDSYTGNERYYTTSYSGTGGLNQIFAGVGVQVFKGLSMGANVGYLWGDMNHSIIPLFYDSGSSSSVSSPTKYFNNHVQSYTVDFGVQYEQALEKGNSVTVGATYSLGHKLNGESSYISGVTQLDTVTVNNALEMPHMFGFGAAYHHGKQWSVGLDYSLQLWNSCGQPSFEGFTSSSSYKDRHSITLGAQYTPDENSNKFMNRNTYTFGLSYTTPYVQIDGNDGPKEMAASAGVSVPIRNGWNSRSCVNLALQWVNCTPSDKQKFVTENYFRIHVGITFNEKWFEKWKVK